MREPLFSVVIPTYNRAGTVARTLASCFAQRCDDFEAIVVDDGSTDGTPAALAALDDPRLRVIEQDNAGPAAARNRGVAAARGRHVAFLDSDDLWYPGYLAQARDALDETPDALLYGRIVVDRGVGRYWIKPDRAIAPDESIYDYLYVDGQFVQTSTLIVPIALARAVRWEESVTYGDNDQFAIDCWRAGASFRMLPEPMTLYADATSADALSQLPLYAGRSDKHVNFFAWMATQREHMSERAWAGYRARHESVALVREAPLESLALLWRAHRRGVFGASGLARRLLQTFAPRGYRRLTDRYVGWRGLPPEAVGRTEPPSDAASTARSPAALS